MSSHKTSYIHPDPKYTPSVLKNVDGTSVHGYSYRPINGQVKVPGVRYSCSVSVVTGCSGRLQIIY